MGDLDEEDIVWGSERQGELLRRRAACELVNEAELDWPNIAEEIESIGHAERDQLIDRLPILRARLDDIVTEAYGDADLIAARETELPEETFPPACPWTFEEAVLADF